MKSKRSHEIMGRRGGETILSNRGLHDNHDLSDVPGRTCPERIESLARGPGGKAHGGTPAGLGSMLHVGKKQMLDKRGAARVPSFLRMPKSNDRIKAAIPRMKI
jgi:hypothetical protein